MLFSSLVSVIPTSYNYFSMYNKFARKKNGLLFCIVMYYLANHASYKLVRFCCQLSLSSLSSCFLPSASLFPYAWIMSRLSLSLPPSFPMFAMMYLPGHACLEKLELKEELFVSSLCNNYTVYVMFYCSVEINVTTRLSCVVITIPRSHWVGTYKNFGQGRDMDTELIPFESVCWSS